MTYRRPIDVWKSAPYDKLEEFDNRNIARNIREKAKYNAAKYKTLELNVGDYVRVKLSQLYSQIRQML